MLIERADNNKKIRDFMARIRLLPKLGIIILTYKSDN